MRSDGRSRTKMCIVSCILGFAALLATGCAEKYWYQEGRTFDECRADRAACRAELLQRTDLRSIGEYERRFMEDCMERRGYRLVSEKELPLDVKREASDMPSEVQRARGYGVAGSITK